MRIRSSASGFAARLTIAGGWVLALSLICAPASRPALQGGRNLGSMAEAAGPQHPSAPPVIAPPSQPGAPPAMTVKRRQAILEARFKKMKERADELARTAQALQADLDKSNANVLSVDVVEKADRIEKLARQIRNAAVE